MTSSEGDKGRGPLAGVRVIELEAIGPVPFCGGLFADMGADVIRIDRATPAANRLPDHPAADVARGRRSIGIDLKSDRGREIALDLIANADVVIEGFRPGVTERLGIGPDQCAARNPGLVYGRATGWGREGPLAERAGHDINYIGLVGALHAVGEAGGAPIPPLNLLADYGGGALYLAVGVLAALFDRDRSGAGRVVDAAMVDGAASLMSVIYELRSRGAWLDERGTNLLDGAAPFYTTYRTADDRWVAVGALEPRFYEALVGGLGLVEGDLPDRNDVGRWAELRGSFAAAFASRTRDEWEAEFAGTDGCVTPVLSLDEAPLHPHLRARRTFVDRGRGPEPAPAPRFPGSEPPPAAAGRSDTDVILADLGRSLGEIEEMRGDGTVA